MKIGVIQASSQISKNELLYHATENYAKGHAVINFGCDINETDQFSYIDISIAVGLLLASESVDFVVTGCSSGQGMMLACNNMPGVLCGYAPTPKDAYLFAQINHGNAISLPLGEEYTFTGEENLKQTIEALFSEPFGQGYPKSEADRKKRDTLLLKDIRHHSQVGILKLLNSLDQELIEHVMSKKDAMDWILNHGKNETVLRWIRQHSMKITREELLDHIEDIHTTKMGEERIKQNLNTISDDVVTICKQMILNPEAIIERSGKNWYVTVGKSIITINAHSYTIITAHKS